jgi:hypothetical protein
VSEGETHQQAQARLVAGRYWLLREPGRDGMGSVWLAEDQSTRRRLAVKGLRPSPGLPDPELAAFRARGAGERGRDRVQPQ